MEDKKEGCRSRSRSRSIGGGKKFRNPFLNFIQDYIKELPPNLSYKEVLIRAGKKWCKLPKDKKKCYIEQAASAPRRSRKSKRSKSRSRRRSRGNTKCDDYAKNNHDGYSDDEDQEDDDGSHSSFDSVE